jgi:LytS/YehU family sensor histidine kinase
MRYENTLNVNFKIEGDLTQHKIVPLLLITFVENAFKHGKVADEENPLSIQLYASHKALSFAIKNKKSNGTKEKSSGIGLQNIKTRLELVYPGKHTLQINDNHDFYAVNLTIEN